MCPSSTYKVLVVNPTVPVNSVSELVAYLKKEPGKYTFSSADFGTPAHLIGVMFELETGMERLKAPTCWLHEVAMAKPS